MAHTLHSAPAKLVRWARSLYKLNAEHIRSAALKRRKAVVQSDPMQLPAAVQSQARCGFVLSSGRSGTALLTQVLAASPQIYALHQALPELAWLSAQAYQEIDRRGEAYKLAFLHARYEQVREAYLRGMLYVETSNRNTFYAPVLAKVFHRAKIMHLVRHPGEFARSALRRGYYTGVKSDEGRVSPRPDDPAYERWAKLSQLEKIGWLWNATNAFIEDFKATQPAGSVLTIRSSDLFSDAEAAARIFAHLDVEPPPREKLAKVIAHKVNAQLSGNIQRFDDWPAQEREILQRCTPLAASYGYEL